MGILYVLVLLVAGFIGGFINAVSAAGSLILLPALIFAGLTPGGANATNRVVILMQNLSSSAGFKTKGFQTENYMWWLALATVPGAVLGAWFAVKIPGYLFNNILIGVMFLFLIITIVNPLQGGAGAQILSRQKKWWGVLLYFFIGIYGGFIQAGSGFFLMAGCLLLFKFDVIKTNYYKAVIMLTYTIAAFLIFLWKGNINWYYGIVTGVGASVGGFLGSRWSIYANGVWVRRIIVLFILLMLVALIIKQFVIAV